MRCNKHVYHPYYYFLQCVCKIITYTCAVEATAVYRPMTGRIVRSPPAGTFSESSCRREQQGDRQLGRGVGEHAGRVADDDTSPRALRQVDVVRPHRVGAHRPQTAACRPTETGDQQAGEMGTRASQKYIFGGGGGGGVR